MITQATIDRILDAADIIDVVSDFVTLKKRGINYIGLCPFHSDKTPSLCVSQSKRVYKCFACGEGGNVVHFIMEHEKLSYPEALRWLAKKYHIEIEERECSSKEKQEQHSKESIYAVNEFACKLFQYNLFNSTGDNFTGIEYFRQRGISEDVMKKFQLGYSLPTRDDLAKKAMQKGFQKEFLIKSGVCYEKDDKSIKDRFVGRVIFPWLNISGRVVAFGGRLLNSETKGVYQKYVNSPESEIYSKRKELYGVYQAKNAIAKFDKVYMVEGYTDVIAMHQCGIENVVANSGTALSKEQIKLLHRFTSNITLIYDGDDAGVKASIRGVNMLLSEGMNVRILLLPHSDDPDSFIRRTAPRPFKEYIEENEENFVRFLAKLELGKAKGAPAKFALLINTIAQSISQIPNHTLRYSYIKECASVLSVEEQVVLDEVRRFVEDKAEERTDTYENAKKNIDTETVLARLLVKYGESKVFEVKDEKGNNVPVSVAEFMYYDLANDGLKFQNPVYWEMVKEAAEKSNENGFQSRNHFLFHPNFEVSKAAAELVLDNFDLCRSNANEIKKDANRLQTLIPHVLLEFKLGILKKEMNEILNKLFLLDASKDFKEIAEYMKEHKNLADILKEISKKTGDRVVMKT